MTRPIGSVLNQSPRLAEIVPGVPRDAWLRAIGREFRDRMRPQSLRNGLLRVEVPSAATSQHVFLKSQEILSSLEREGIKATTLRTRVNGTMRITYPKEAAYVRPLEELPPALQERLDKIEDPELREVIARGARYGLGEKR